MYRLALYELARPIHAKCGRSAIFSFFYLHISIFLRNFA